MALRFARPVRRWIGRRGLNAKLVLFSAVFTAIVICASFLALRRAVTDNTRQFVAGDLAVEQQVLIDLQHRSLTQLLATSSLMMQSPNLRAAMETYRLEAQDGEPRDELLAVIHREAAKIAGMDKDLLVLTDDFGIVLAAVTREGAGPAVGQDLSGIPAVSRALDPLADIDRSNFAVLETDAHRVQAGVVPIVLQGRTIGTLALGDRLDEEYVADLQSSFRGDIAITVGDRLIRSTLPEGAAQSISGSLRPSGDGSGESVQLGGEEYMAASLVLGRDRLGHTVSLHLLHSVTAILRPVRKEFLAKLAVYGALAVVLATFGAGWIARSVLGPLNRFVEFVRTEARSGVGAGHFERTDETPEVTTLCESYNSLMDSLAQEHHNLEERTSELSAANEILTEEISERKRVEAELRASEEQLLQSQKMEAVGTLAGGVAHDFNNLLSVMASYSDLAIETVGPSSPVYDDLSEIKAATERAALLTNQLLAFSRRQVLRPEVLNLNETVESVDKMLRRIIGEDMELRTVTRTPLPMVKADPGQMEQILVNLAVNARDAMPAGGTLVLETQAVELDEDYAARKPPATAGPFVMLAVSDTGMGMNDATRERIFEPFFTTKSLGKGTGLGLSTVYGIVKQSGGFIWVYSEPHVGTTFKIYLPQVAGSASQSVAVTDEREQLNGSETILLVEDDDIVRRLAEKCLQRFGYSVLPAANPRDALVESRQYEGAIDLLLTDVVMPYMSGKELASKLRMHRPQTQVLYMSGYTTEAVRNHGILEPGTHFLQKPFNPTVLAGKIRDVLDPDAVNA